jgi:zinc/manganese transport system substrate-binding protein
MRTVLVTVLAMRLGSSVAALVVAALTALVGACSDDAVDDRASIVVTTGVLGDVVANLVGEAADVEIVMPPGADPHDFSPSAKQAAAMRDADVLVVNGLGFEAGLRDAIAAAEGDGVSVYTATSAVEVLRGSSESAEGDPHVFTDPARMVTIAEDLARFLAENVDALDSAAVEKAAAAYVADLRALDLEVEATLAAVPPARRTLVTNHDVFAYFADRYGFEILGVVIPGGSTLAEPSAADLASLAADVEAAGVPAVFAETSSPARLAEVLAGEVDFDVEVVELFTESLGEPGSGGETYIDMVRTNAERIAEALS